MRPLLSTLLLLLVVAPAAAQTSLCVRLRALTQDPSVATAHWGIAVETLDGTLLCGINQAQLFRPASNAKIFTVGAALALLGPRQTVTTTISGPPIENATLTGDLVLHGAGDANLTARPMPYTPIAGSPRAHPLETLAMQIAALGLTHITGGIVGDDSVWPNHPYAPGWTIDDFLFGYGAPVSALDADDNKLTLTVHPGPTANTPAPAELKPDWTPGQQPATPFYSIVNDVRTLRPGSPTAIEITADAQQPRTLHLTGTVALGGPPYVQDIAITDPALYAAMRLRDLLIADGIQVDGPAAARHMDPVEASRQQAQAARTPLHLTAAPCASCQASPEPCPDPCIGLHTIQAQSVPLLDDVTVTLKVSQNLHAELFLRRLGAAYLGTGSGAAGSRVVRQFWINAGLPAEDLNLVDGSGLSVQDLVTPRTLAQALVYAHTQSWGTTFKAALPVGGTDGSLTTRFTGALRGKVFAKTGTLGESRALSGYLIAASGQTLVFSILVDNHLPTTTADRTVMDRLVEQIAAAN